MQNFKPNNFNLYAYRVVIIFANRNLKLFCECIIVHSIIDLISDKIKNVCLCNKNVNCMLFSE